MSFFKSAAALVVLGTVAASQSHADVMLDIRTLNGANVETSNFLLGETVTVGVFAVDNGGAAPFVATGPIAGFNATLTADTTDPNDFGGLAGVTFNPNFAAGFPDNDTGTVTGSDFTVPAGVFFSDSVGLGGFFGAASGIELFRFSYLADVLGPTTFNMAGGLFSYENPATTAALTLTFDPGASLMVTAIPEPSGVALLALAGVGLAASRRRRRNA